ASLLTIPAAILIDKGRMVLVVFGALFCNVLGLAAVSVSQAFPVLLLGVFGTGIGYILIVQTLTAWMKNLFPEEQRGQ
ncbi:MFS transporter, partial [Klebsiella oxytoca]